MKKITLFYLLTILSFTSFSALAQPAWYVGKVSRVALSGSDGTFVVMFKNAQLDDCQYKYAYFYGSKLGDAQLKHAYSMALTSVTAGLDMGIVIDKTVRKSVV